MGSTRTFKFRNSKLGVFCSGESHMRKEQAANEDRPILIGAAGPLKAQHLH